MQNDWVFGLKRKLGFFQAPADSEQTILQEGFQAAHFTGFVDLEATLQAPELRQVSTPLIESGTEEEDLAQLKYREVELSFWRSVCLLC